MRRHGYTARGTPRWYCPRCRKTGIRSRPDTRERHARRRFVSWLVGKASTRELAHTYRVSRQTVSRRFQPHFQQAVSWPVPPTIRILVLDGSYVHGRWLVVLVALTEDGIACWMFAPRETAAAWSAFLIRLPRPEIVVCDGQKGLLKAIREVWPGIAIQRCHFHILQLARRYLTRRPKTEAGREIQILMRGLARIRVETAAQAWRLAYEAWEGRYALFLAERTYYRDGTRVRWWYTHRHLRGMRSLVQGALPHLFTFLRYPGTPNTTNHVEGGVNAMIAESLRLHRGLRLHQKETLVSLLLAERNRRRNATRKFT